jgi:tryptophan-rich sensory protein
MIASEAHLLKEIFFAVWSILSTYKNVKISNQNKVVSSLWRIPIWQRIHSSKMIASEAHLLKEIFFAVWSILSTYKNVKISNQNKVVSRLNLEDPNFCL